MGKWFLAFALLIIAIVSAVVVFTITGVLNTQAIAWEMAESISWLQPHLAVYSKGQDAETWKAEQQSELDHKLAELQEFEQDLLRRETDLDQLAQQLDKWENELTAREQDLEQERLERLNSARLTEIYTEMEITEAARILQEMDEQIVLEVISRMDPQTAANVLSAFPTDLAASVSKQLTGGVE